MNVLISSVKIVDTNSPYHVELDDSSVDILIEDGIVTKIAKSIKPQKNYTIVEADDLHISPAWFDPFVDFCEPGFEHKEDIASGLKAAEAGGFTAVGILPNTNPVVDNKTLIEYLKFKGLQANTACEIYPIGATSKNLDGVHLSEMYEMHRAGAIAFSGGQKAIGNTGAMLRSLQYVLPFDGIIVNLPDDATFSADTHMNEGFTSTQMGTKGKPNMAELLMIQRDIELAKYTNSRVHVSQVSTQEGVKAIRQAKKENVKITASVSPWHLVFEDNELINFDTNWKINPPLRSKVDRMALNKGLKTGRIDFVSSFHQPQDEDCKKLEFDKADFGVIGLQSCFPLLMQAGCSIPETIKVLSINARKIFGLAIPTIAVGEKANYTLFQPKEKYVLTEKMIRSKSKNTPLLNKELTGKVVGVINKGILSLNE